MFEYAARLIDIFYSWTHSYSAAFGLVAVVVMLLITPLTLKSTKGMLEMQRLNQRCDASKKNSKVIVKN